MKSPICVTHRKQTASFSIASLMLAIAPLWLMLAAVNISAHAQTTSSPADWTQFHRDNMQRWNSYETILGVNNVGSLQVEWRNSGTSAPRQYPSPLAVVNGVVYFGSPEGNGNLYAVNAITGAKLWSYAIGTPVVSSPAVANGVVYVGSWDHNVYALNAITGAKLWSYTTGSNVFSSPAVANGVVYIGSLDHNVYALNASTGAKLWSYTTGAGVHSSPAVANGTVYVGSDDFNVYALNASTGAKLWSYTAGGEVWSSPAVANGAVYVGTTNMSTNVYALNASTGAKLWSYRTGDSVTDPAVANGVVYVGSADGSAYALNASTGVKLWSYFTGPGEYAGSPAVANGVVYFNVGDTIKNVGSMIALDASTGATLWDYSILTFSSPATIVNGVVYVNGADLNTGVVDTYAFAQASAGSADLFLRIQPTPTTVHQGDLLTFAFPVWNLGPGDAEGEVLSNLQVPAGTTFDYVRISGTPGLGKCTTPPYGGTGQIICHEGDGMAPNTTWTVRLTVRVTAAAGSTITANAATMADTPDPNLANNMATVSVKVQ
jgi:outer membrane protein assembly factor BamB